MMSSVPYVPPDTMKNVAATSGQSVSFAFLFVEVTARAGNWAGRDKVLNFLSRPPSPILAFSQPHAWSAFESCRIRIFSFDARKMCMEPKIFSPRSSVRWQTFHAVAQRSFISGGGVVLQVEFRITTWCERSQEGFSESAARQTPAK